MKGKSAVIFEIDDDLEQQLELPGERERLRFALLTDQHERLTILVNIWQKKHEWMGR